MQKHLQPPLNEEDEEKYKPILIAECVSREYFLKYGELSHVHRLNLIGDKLFIFEVHDRHFNLSLSDFTCNECTLNSFFGIEPRKISRTICGAVDISFSRLEWFEIYEGLRWRLSFCRQQFVCSRQFVCTHQTSNKYLLLIHNRLLYPQFYFVCTRFLNGIYSLYRSC